MDLDIKIDNLSLTKEKLDRCFEAFDAVISEDADLLLEFIGKKADLEIDAIYRKSLNSDRISTHNLKDIRIKSLNPNLIKFTEDIVENSINNYIEIQAIRKALIKLCPLWPIC